MFALFFAAVALALLIPLSQAHRPAHDLKPYEVHPHVLFSELSLEEAGTKDDEGDGQKTRLSPSMDSVSLFYPSPDSPAAHEGSLWPSQALLHGAVLVSLAREDGEKLGGTTSDSFAAIRLSLPPSWGPSTGAGGANDNHTATEQIDCSVHLAETPEPYWPFDTDVFDSASVLNAVSLSGNSAGEPTARGSTIVITLEDPMLLSNAARITVLCHGLRGRSSYSLNQLDPLISAGVFLSLQMESHLVTFSELDFVADPAQIFLAPAFLSIDVTTPSSSDPNWNANRVIPAEYRARLREVIPASIDPEAPTTVLQPVARFAPLLLLITPELFSSLRASFSQGAIGDRYDLLPMGEWRCSFEGGIRLVPCPRGCGRRTSRQCRTVARPRPVGSLDVDSGDEAGSSLTSDSCTFASVFPSAPASCSPAILSASFSMTAQNGLVVEYRTKDFFGTGFVAHVNGVLQSVSAGGLTVCPSVIGTQRVCARGQLIEFSLLPEEVLFKGKISFRHVPNKWAQGVQVTVSFYASTNTANQIYQISFKTDLNVSPLPPPLKSRVDFVPSFSSSDDIHASSGSLTIQVFDGAIPPSFLTNANQSGVPEIIRVCLPFGATFDNDLSLQAHIAKSLLFSGSDDSFFLPAENSTYVTTNVTQPWTATGKEGGIDATCVDISLPFEATLWNDAPAQGLALALHGVRIDADFGSTTDMTVPLLFISHGMAAAVSTKARFTFSSDGPRSVTTGYYLEIALRGTVPSVVEHDRIVSQLRKKANGEDHILGKSVAIERRDATTVSLAFFVETDLFWTLPLFARPNPLPSPFHNATVNLKEQGTEQFTASFSAVETEWHPVGVWLCSSVQSPGVYFCDDEPVPTCPAPQIDLLCGTGVGLALSSSPLACAFTPPTERHSDQCGERFASVSLAHFTSSSLGLLITINPEMSPVFSNATDVDYLLELEVPRALQLTTDSNNLCSSSAGTINLECMVVSSNSTSSLVTIRLTPALEAAGTVLTLDETISLSLASLSYDERVELLLDVTASSESAGTAGESRSVLLSPSRISLGAVNYVTSPEQTLEKVNVMMSVETSEIDENDLITFTATAIANQSPGSGGFNAPIDTHGESFVYDRFSVLLSTQLVLATQASDASLSCVVTHSNATDFDDSSLAISNPLWPFSEKTLLFTSAEIERVVTGSSLSSLEMSLAVPWRLNMVSMIAVTCSGIPAILTATNSLSSDRIAFVFVDSTKQQAFRQSVGRLPWVPISESAPRSRARDRLPSVAPSIVAVPFVAAGMNSTDATFDTASLILRSATNSALEGTQALVSNNIGQRFSQVPGTIIVAARFPAKFAGVASIIGLSSKSSSSLSVAVRAALSEAGVSHTAPISPLQQPPYWVPREGEWLCFADKHQLQLEACMPSSPCDSQYQGEVVCSYPVPPAGSFRHVPSETPNVPCSFSAPPSPSNASESVCSATFTSVEASFALAHSGHLVNETQEYGSLFVSFTLNTSSTSPSDFLLRLVDIDLIFDFVSAECYRRHDPFWHGEGMQVSCNTPPEGGLAVKLYNVTESGAFEVKFIFLNSWSRSALLGVSVNHLNDDSNIYLGDPVIKIGGVGVFTFAATHSLSAFLPTRADGASGTQEIFGDLLIGIDHVELLIVDFSPSFLYLVPPSEWSVQSCRIALRTSSASLVWPLALDFSEPIPPISAPGDDRLLSFVLPGLNASAFLDDEDDLHGSFVRTNTSEGIANISGLWIVCSVSQSEPDQGQRNETLQVSVSLVSQTLLADLVDPLQIALLGGDASAIPEDDSVSVFASFQLDIPSFSSDFDENAVAEALGVQVRLAQLASGIYQVSLQLDSFFRVLAPAVLVPAILLPSLGQTAGKSGVILRDSSLLPRSQTWGYFGAWKCGFGPFEECVVPNNCGDSFSKPIVCSVPYTSSLHPGGTWEPPENGTSSFDPSKGLTQAFTSEDGISQFVSDTTAAACSFLAPPQQRVTSGCGQLFCRDPRQARVSCNSPDVCFAGCSTEARSIGEGDLALPPFKPFCSLSRAPDIAVDAALFCPSSVVPRPTYSKSCLPRSTCSFVCGNKAGFAVSCDSDESWGPCSVSCGNGIQQRIMNCTAPPLPQTGSRISSLGDTMCSFSRFSDPTVRSCGGSRCSDYQWYCSSNNGETYVPCDSAGPLSGPWAPCSTDCGSGTQTRRVTCAAIDSKGSVTATGLPDGSCTPRSAKPAASIPCSSDVCAKAEWKCYPAEGDPTKPQSCDSLGGFNCPTSGCGVSIRKRSIGCYNGATPIASSKCRADKAPLEQTQCPAVTNSCSVSFRDSLCVYNASGDPDLSLETPCVPSLGTEPEIFMRGSCLDLVGEKVPDSWCGTTGDLLKRCDLPPCSDDLRFEWRTAPGVCLNASNMCATYRLVSVTCHAISSGIANITVSSALCDQSTRPPSAEACFPETDGVASCANGGICSNEPVRIDGVLYPLVVTGTCICVSGTGGPLCEEKLRVSNLSVGLRGSTDWRFRWAVSSSSIFAPAIISVRSSSMLEPLVIGIVDSRTQELLVPLTTLALLTSPGTYTVFVKVPFDETNATFEHSPLCMRPGFACANNGICNQVTGTCTCRGEYTGPTCVSTPCDMKGCNPAASTCAINAAGVARCECATSPLTGLALFKGDRCQVPVGGCDPGLDKCFNGGERTGYINAAGQGVCGACSCPGHFSGDLCEQCSLDELCHHGAPDATCGSCLCHAGFMGPDCSCRYTSVTFLLDASEGSGLKWYAEAASVSKTISRGNPAFPTAVRWLSGIDSALSFIINDPDISSSVFEHRLVQNLSGESFIQIVARVSGKCGSDLGVVRTFSTLNSDPEMYRIYTALSRILAQFEKTELSTSFPPLSAFVRSAGIGFHDPNCVQAERCPKNVGNGGTILDEPGPVDPVVLEPPRSGLSRDEIIALSVVLSLALVGIFVSLLYAWRSHSCCFANRSEFDDFVEDEAKESYGSI